MQRGRDLIKSEVRRRILLHNGDKDLVLFEGKLADEFGVSRTPIRQVIQALAAESLVEVRSGIGTIAPPLLPERRSQDLKAYSAILNACASCAGSTNFNMFKVELTTLRIHLETNGASSQNDIFFDVATKFVAALSELVDDKILKDSLVACFWRFIRRRIDDHESNIALVIQELIETIKDVEHGAESGDPERTLRMASANVDIMINS